MGQAMSAGVRALRKAAEKHSEYPERVNSSMVNLDPDSASPAPEVLKAVVRANQNNAGIYGAVTRMGRLAVGQTILLRAATEKRERG
jgi:hypothetical protein